MGAYILGGGLFAGGSAAPTYPTTGLVQGLIPSGIQESAGIVTSWTAVAGTNGAVELGTGAATFGSGGVLLSGSSRISFTPISIPINTPFTAVAVGYRDSASKFWIPFTDDSTSNSYLFYAYANPTLRLLTSLAGPFDASGSMSLTGHIPVMLHRKTDGTLWVKEANDAAVQIIRFPAIDLNSEIFRFGWLGRRAGAFDGSDDTTSHEALLIYSGLDVTENSGQFAQLNAWLLATFGKDLT